MRFHACLAPGAQQTQTMAQLTSKLMGCPLSTGTRSPSQIATAGAPTVCPALSTRKHLNAPRGLGPTASASGGPRDQQQQQQQPTSAWATSAVATPTPFATTADAPPSTLPPSAPGGAAGGPPLPRSRGEKVLWVCSESAAVAEAARKINWPLVTFKPPAHQGETLTAGNADYLVSGSIVYQVIRAEGGPENDKKGKDGKEGASLSLVGAHVRVEKGSDQQQLAELALAFSSAASPSSVLSAMKRAAGIETAAEAGEEDQEGDSHPPCVVLEVSDWKIITAENAVAMFQSTPVSVIGIVSNAQDARLLLQALEVGLDGAILRTDSVDEVVALKKMMDERVLAAPGKKEGLPPPKPTATAPPAPVTPGAPASSPQAPPATSSTTFTFNASSPAPPAAPPASQQAQAPPVTRGPPAPPAVGAGAQGMVGTPGVGMAGVGLRWARLTKVQACGSGHRVCVDLCSLLDPGAGLMVGSFARGMFVVHSECLPSEFVPTRPFRVNAGPVHSYVALPGGKTAYLSEIGAGSEVLVVDALTGESTVATVGRAKVEIRPMMLLEAEVQTDPNSTVNNSSVNSNPSNVTIFLQNAETVRLMVPASEAAPGTSPSRAGGGAPVAHQLGEVSSKSIAELKVGDRVMVGVMEEASVARHTGLAVDEYILEQ